MVEVEARPGGRTDARVSGVVAAVVGGVALALEGWANGELGRVYQDGFLAALVSFLCGLVVLLAVVVPTRAGREGFGRLRVALRERRIRWWQCVGGSCGAFFVATQGLTIAVLGVAVFTVAVVAGQVVGSLVVDRVGVGSAARQAFTAPRLVGAALAVVAVVVAVSDDLDRPTALWPAVLPALAGAVVGWQAAVNGLVREASRSAAVTTTVNFVVGTTVLAAVCAVELAVRGLPDAAWGRPLFYVGGVLGVVAIGTAVLAVRRIGVLLVGLCQVSGQLVGAVAVDVAGGHLSVATLAGTALTLVAVVVAALPGRR
ncbi:DMT family transporter [Actinosynnema sp. NPDC020468]|uniref:DMT family transporter n=1 Tax=Actinosynnema sp. NPDC020468 TaxID=3154488 RepID=UPI0033D64134